MDRRGLLKLAGGSSLATALAVLGLGTDSAYATTTGRATGSVNVRSGPGTTYASIGVLSAGQLVSYAGAVRNLKWQPISYRGRIGYVSNRYLAVVTVSASAVVSTAKVSSAVGTGYASLPAASHVTMPTGVTSRAAGVAAEVRANFPQIAVMYGYRADASSDHHSGRAVDIMMPGADRGTYRSAAEQALGTAIAEHMRANASRLGIQYVIWNQKIWNIARDAEGWRPMANRGSDTANHINHVHVSVR